MDPLAFVETHLRDSRASGTFRSMPVLQSAQGPRIRIEDKALVNMSSNDYLGFANDQELREAAEAGANQWGSGAGAVRTIAGTFEPHEALEHEIAAWKGVEATLVLQSGFTANLGVIPALVGLSLIHI